MSILIKGMAIPKSCSVCPLKAEVEFDEICSQTGEYVCQYDRADDCPIVPVHTPHGRLIDADALFDFIINIYKNAQGDARKAYRDVLDTIVADGDVIEAEEGEP